MTTSTISAREAKLHFWQFLEMVQRWPTIVEKNKRPVCITLSLEDAKNTLIWDFFLEQEEGYEDYFRDKVSTSLSTYLAGTNSTTPHQKTMTSTWQKIFA